MSYTPDPDDYDPLDAAGDAPAMSREGLKRIASLLESAEANDPRCNPELVAMMVVTIEEAAGEEAGRDLFDFLGHHFDRNVMRQALSLLRKP